MKLLFEKINSLIEKNYYNSNFSADSLLKNIDYEKEIIRKTIKKKTGRTISNYIRYYRLNKAQKELNSGKKNISEIAFSSGFSSLSYFSKSYKDEFGLPPNVKLNKTKINLKLKEFIKLFFEEKKSFVLVLSILLFTSSLYLFFNPISSQNIFLTQKDSYPFKEYYDYKNIADSKKTYSEIFLMDTILIKSSMASFEIFWRFNENQKWTPFLRVNDSAVLFPKSISSSVQIMVSEKQAESFFFNLYKKNIDDITSKSILNEGILFESRELLKIDNPLFQSNEKFSKINSFYFDPYEVSNQEFYEFVKDSGYFKKEYWPSKIIVNNKKIPFEKISLFFNDLTGIPSPSSWINGKYPTDMELHPVRGVNWYEAYAYAKYRKKDLPSYDQWILASDNGVLKDPINTFEDHPIKNRAKTNSVNFYGVYDAKYNIKEWISNSFEKENLKGIMGGLNKKNDLNNGKIPSGSLLDILEKWNRNIFNGIRLVKNIDKNLNINRKYKFKSPRDFLNNSKITLSEKNKLFENFNKHKKGIENYSTSDHLPFFGNSYIRTHTVKKEDGNYLKILQFKSDLSVKSKKSVIYFPPHKLIYSSNKDLNNIWEWHIKELVENGFDVFVPQYDGLFLKDSRLIGDLTMDFNFTPENIIKWVNETRTAMDFIFIENENSNVNFFGGNWGAQIGSYILSIENRFSSAVLLRPSLFSYQSNPDFFIEKFVASIKTPVLCITTGNIFNSVEDTQVPYYKLLKNPKKMFFVDIKNFIMSKNEVKKEITNWLNFYSNNDTDLVVNF